MTLSESQLSQLKETIYQLALEENFQDMRVSDINTSGYFEKFKSWLNNGYHGEMSFLERNQELRQHPDSLQAGTCRVLSFRYNYLPTNAQFSAPLKNPDMANISRYALGRDYHKLIRKKLSNIVRQAANQLNLEQFIEARVLVDSAPVLETAFAEKSGLGWKGKHSLIINESGGSWFFLGEIFINQPIQVDAPVEDKCGSCTACISLCPTDAIIDGKTVDARRCISYLTIENKGPIPEDIRTSLGNRVYGCDDCQLACPWNRYSSVSEDKDFYPRHGLESSELKDLWLWDENMFLSNFEGSPVRRIGYQNWLRNLAVAIGNTGNPDYIELLEKKLPDANAMVTEHILWAIKTLGEKHALNNTRSKLLSKTKKLINCVVNMHPRDA
ncbi:tRNA epoxyqueuosine(34) reductase QueG [Aliikangiella sp. G2MR2-5]|uniref:tRNA epoxyqueuosine(34) reductase QueG n=1 Tax=Aliikangiella sp. G2MR2-5 TaxID=2788943 RepID=UPI0018AAE50B|nr:tRNA epoxyqueuosine(34) reductase QueG [Aliikangiella sp. G2MR2-5]